MLVIKTSKFSTSGANSRLAAPKQNRRSQHCHSKIFSPVGEKLLTCDPHPIPPGATLRIACLHTADSNIAVFDAAAEALGLTPDTLSHHSRPDLLAAAVAAGQLTPYIQQQACDALVELAQTADLVLLTCSTLGPSATQADALTTVPVWRVDEALATQAMAKAGKTQVLYAVETTLLPTQQLFERVSRHPQAEVEFVLVEGAWQKFMDGDVAGYVQNVAAAADQAFQQGADKVALAQASMAGAVDLTQFGAPLSSPRCGLRVAIEHLRKRQYEAGLQQNS